MQNRYNPLNVDMSDAEVMLSRSFWNGQKNQHPYYELWRCMRRYCYDEKFTGYAQIGGKGLKCCKTWTDFWTFLEDVELRPDDNFYLYRMNKSIGFFPNNVFWGTKIDFQKGDASEGSFRGYTVTKHGFQAQVTHDGHTLYLGLRKTAKDAQEKTAAFLRKTNPNKLKDMAWLKEEDEKAEALRLQVKQFGECMDDAKSKTLKRAKEMLDMLPECTWAQIASFLWEEGFRTQRNKRWLPEALNQMVLHSPGGDQYRKHKNRGANGHAKNGPVKNIPIPKAFHREPITTLIPSKGTVEKYPELKIPPIKKTVEKIPSPQTLIELCPKAQLISEVKELLNTDLPTEMKYKFLLTLFKEVA